MTNADIIYKRLEARIINGVNSRDVALGIIRDMKEAREEDEKETIESTLDTMKSLVETHGIAILTDPTMEALSGK